MSIDISDFEIFKQYKYSEFENKGMLFNLSSEPYLDIVLTDYCNSRCGFCIGNLAKNKMNGIFELYKEKIIYAINNMNVKEVLLLGGEPTISNNLFPAIEFCNSLPLNKICLTTNGYRLKNKEFRRKLFKSGITHLNISLMNLCQKIQLKANKNSDYLDINSLEDITKDAKQNNVSIRINTNIWRGNLDSKNLIFNHIFDICQIGNIDSIKISSLLKVDNFSVCQETNDWVNEHILSDNEYDKIFLKVIKYFEQICQIQSINNENTFGFVRNTLIPYKLPIIINWNQHGKMMKKVIEERKINNLKLLTNGELSLSWNKEDKNHFIKTNYQVTL